MTQILIVSGIRTLNESLFGLIYYKTQKPLHTHIIEEAGFLSLLLSNHGSYRAKSLWWRADVELGGVGGKKLNLWKRHVSLQAQEEALMFRCPFLIFGPGES